MSHTYRFITAQMSHIYFPYYCHPPCTCLTFNFTSAHVSQPTVLPPWTCLTFTTLPVHMCHKFTTLPPCTCLTFTTLPVPTCHNLPLYHRARVSHLLLYQCPRVTNLPLYHRARVAYMPPIHYFPITSVSLERIIIITIIDRYSAILRSQADSLRSQVILHE